MSKLLKSSLLGLSILVVVYTLFHQFSRLQSTHNKKHGPGVDPGWVEQYRIMKGLKEGQEAPVGMFSAWSKADNANAFKKKKKTGLVNLKEIGPYNIGGRTRDMLIDLANPSRLLACASSGGIWESNNNGNSWKPINDNSSVLWATCITQNPFNHKIIYYGTGEETDNLASINGEGVFKSEDGGKTFEQLQSTVNTNFLKIWDIKHSLVDSSTLYVSTANKGLWKSTNAGDSFYQVYQFGADIHDIEVGPDSSVYIALESRGIFYSKNGEPNTFVELENGLPTSGFNRLDIEMVDGHPKVIYALYAKGAGGYDGSAVGVYKTSNGGKSWKLMGNPQTGTNESFAFPWYCLALGVDPQDSNLLVAGSAGFTYSTDGGKTWRRGSDSHADYHSFAFRPDKARTFYATNDGGIYEYTWDNIASRSTDKNSSYNVTQFYAGSFAPDSLGVLGGAQDNWTTYGRDGKQNFIQVYGGDGAFCHIHQQFPDIAYVSSQNGNLRKTGALNNAIPATIRATGNMDANFDGTIDDGAWFINPFEMNYLNGDLLFFPTRRRLWMSFDGAQSWNALSNFKSNLYAVGIPNNANPNKVYFGGDNIALFRIDDFMNSTAGNEISLNTNNPTQLNGGFISCIKVHPRNDGILYVTLSNFSNAPRVWRIENAETNTPTWTDISGDLPKGLPANWIEVDPYRPDDYFMLATDFGLYTSSDGGSTWTKEDRIPNTLIYNIRLRNTDRKLFVYTHGRGVFAANLSKMEDPFIGIENKLKSPKISVYPNPASTLLNIDLLGKFNYQIVDIAGKEVAIGTAEKNINLTDLKKGSYILIIKQEQKTYRAEFLKQ